MLVWDIILSSSFKLLEQATAAMENIRLNLIGAPVRTVKFSPEVSDYTGRIIHVAFESSDCDSIIKMTLLMETSIK